MSHALPVWLFSSPGNSSQSHFDTCKPIKAAVKQACNSSLIWNMQSSIEPEIKSLTGGLDLFSTIVKKRCKTWYYSAVTQYL